MACELQLLEQYYDWGKSGALQWNSNSVCVGASPSGAGEGHTAQ